MITTTKFKLTLQYLPVYQCRDCRREQTGGTASVEMEGGSIETIGMLVNRQQLRVSHMPVGWSSYYSPAMDYFLCPRCASSTQQVAS